MLPLQVTRALQQWFTSIPVSRWLATICLYGAWFRSRENFFELSRLGVLESVAAFRQHKSPGQSQARTLGLLDCLRHLTSAASGDHSFLISLLPLGSVRRSGGFLLAAAMLNRHCFLFSRHVVTGFPSSNRQPRVLRASQWPRSLAPEQRFSRKEGLIVASRPRAVVAAG